MNTQHTPQMIIPNNFGTPTGTPLNYDELQARIAAVKRSLAFAEEQRDYYEAAYAEYVSKAEKLEAEYPVLLNELNKVSGDVKKLTSKLDPRIQVDVKLHIRHELIMTNWDYDTTLNYYKSEAESIQNKLPEYRVNVKLAQKQLDELEQYLK